MWSSMVECLFSLYETLSSTPSTRGREGVSKDHCYLVAKLRAQALQLTHFIGAIPIWGAACFETSRMGGELQKEGKGSHTFRATAFIPVSSALENFSGERRAPLDPAEFSTEEKAQV